MSTSRPNARRTNQKSVLDACVRCGSRWGMQIATDGRIVCPKCEHITETVTSRVHDSGEPLPESRGDALWFGCLKPASHPRAAAQIDTTNEEDQPCC